MKPTVTAGFPSSFPYLKHKLTHIQSTECNYLCLVFLQLQLHVKKNKSKVLWLYWIIKVTIQQIYYTTLKDSVLSWKVFYIIYILSTRDNIVMWLITQKKLQIYIYIYIYIYQKNYTSTSPKPKLTSWIPLLANVNARRKNAPRNSFYIFRQQRNLLHCNTCCIISDYHPQNCRLFINLSFPFQIMFFIRHALKFQYPPPLDGGWRMEQA